MREYIVKKIDIDDAIAAPVDLVGWEEFPYKPETNAFLSHNGEVLFIKLQTNEKNLRAVMTAQNSAVCQDSCMEFFIRPNKDDARYFNFEINPIGTLHLGFGENRHNRHKISEKEIFKIKSVIENGIWTITFRIPFSFFDEYTGFSKECYANFYKCGEGTDHSHFCTWNKVETPAPDFHQSSFFGRLVFEEI